MKKRNILIIISTLIIAIVVLSIVLILNKNDDDHGTTSVELAEMMKKFDIRLNVNADEYYIYGLKPQGKFDNYTVEIPDSVDGIPVTELHDATDFIKYQDHNIKIVKLGKNVRYIIGNVKGNDESSNPYGENIFLSANSLVSIEVSNENQTFASNNGVLFSKDLTILVKYPNGKSSGSETSSNSYSIPKMTKQIYNHAFYNNTLIETVTFDENVSKISKEAFANCSKLSSVQFNSGIEVIENRAFSGCQNLKSIDLPEKLTKLSRGIFSRCINLENIYLPDTLSTDSCFEDEAFTGCVNISRIYTSEQNYEAICQIIKKYPIFAEKDDDQISHLVIIK